MKGQPILVVSLDGVAPRFVSQVTMPRLCELALAGASTFDARTVHPSITLPAHISMLRGVSPGTHGVIDNTPAPLDPDWPSFLQVAREAGRSTAAMLNWAPINGIVEPSAAQYRFYLDSGYRPDDDHQVTGAAVHILSSARPDVAFAYLVTPDNVGHEHGWGSEAYLAALHATDQRLGRLIDAAGPASAILVTTDHGGHGHDHQQSTPIDQITFVTLRAADVEPASILPGASVLDIAPTVAALAQFEPAPTWEGRSLLGTERPIVDHLIERLGAMSEVSYGEQVTMLEHSLQTADHAVASGATEEQQIAALFHDIGHLRDEAGTWGLPSHAEVGATLLQQWFAPAVADPIRLHVQAKRWLVTADPAYHDRLSEASRQTLAQQGGPLDDASAAAFVLHPAADAAVKLRQWDDGGKSLPEGLGGHERLEAWRPTLARVLGRRALSPRTLFGSCVCDRCVDPVSGQRLTTVSDGAGWHWLGATEQGHRLQRMTGDLHEVVEPGVSAPVGAQLWSAADRTEVLEWGTSTDVAGFAARLVRWGFAAARDLAAVDGAVVDFAESLGHVRTTNYGQRFDVVSVEAATNLAYTDLSLTPHTDNPYRDPVPTVQLLHCLEPADEGGSTTIVDGWAAADQLRDQAPDAFAVLTSTPVDFRFVSAETHLEARAPLITMTADGDIGAVRLNHRSMIMPTAASAGPDFADAYQHFDAIVTDPANTITFKLQRGDVFAVDNRRVLHGRSAVVTPGKRHLQGCYLDIDAVRSLVSINTPSN